MNNALQRQKKNLEIEIQAQELQRAKLLHEISLLNYTPEQLKTDPALGFYIELRAREVLNYADPEDYFIPLDSYERDFSN